MAVPGVGESNFVAEMVQQRSRFEMGYVDDDAAIRFDNAGQLGDEATIISDVLQKIDDDHLVERSSRERCRAAADLVDVGTDQLPDRSHRLSIEVGASPISPALAQQI